MSALRRLRDWTLARVLFTREERRSGQPWPLEFFDHKGRIR